MVRTVVARIVVAFAAMLLLAGAAQAQAQSEKRIAFVVGNAAYQSGALPTTANDAGLIAQTLQAAGFDVVGARDLDQDSLRHAFRDFLDKASTSGPDTVALVYLAGYGLQLEGENYFVPVDAKIATPSAVPVEAVRISDLTKPLAALQLKASIVVIDGARFNNFAKGNQPLAGGLALVDADAKMLIAFNAAPGTVGPPEHGPYGVYAQSLAEMMRAGGLPLADVFDRTRLRVSEKTNGALLPWSTSRVTEPFVFFDRGAGAPAPQVSYDTSKSMQEQPIADFKAGDAYAAALERDTLRGYEDFLAAYPDDPMAKRVRAIVAARRESITWRETYRRDTPNAYWSYLKRYPRGPHAWDARRRLDHFQAAFEPPASFELIDYDVPPPPEDEIVYVDRPVFIFSDPDFDLPPPPPPPEDFLPPPPEDFVVLQPPVETDIPYMLPSPLFVPVPAYISAPRYVVPPPDNFIYPNLHNAPLINETLHRPFGGQAAVQQQGQGGPTAGQVVTGAALGAAAAAVAARVALPPYLRKRQGAAPQTPGVRTAPGTVAPGQALPGANGQNPAAIPGQAPRRAKGPGAQTLPATKVQPGVNALPGAPGAQPLPGAQAVPGAQALPGTAPGKPRRGKAIPGAAPAVNGQPGAPVIPGAQAAPGARVLPGGRLPAGGKPKRGQPPGAPAPAPGAVPQVGAQPVKPPRAAPVQPRINAPAAPKPQMHLQPRPQPQIAPRPQPRIAPRPAPQARPAPAPRAAPPPAPRAAPRAAPPPAPRAAPRAAPPPPPRAAPAPRACGRPGLPPCPK